MPCKDCARGGGSPLRWAAAAALAARMALGGAVGDPAAGAPGPLGTPSASPGHLLRPSGLFLPIRPVERETVRGSLGLSWANVWCYEPGRYLIDGEWIRLNARLYYGLTDSLALGLWLPVIGRTGGFADATIEGFHDLFGFTNSDRDQFPRNRSVVRLLSRDSGGARTVAEGDSWGIGDVALLAVWSPPGGRGSPSLALQASFPTGDERELEGLGAPSAGTSGLGVRRIGRSSAHAFAGGGISYSPLDRQAPVPLRRTVYSGLLGVEYRSSPSVSILAQSLYSSAVARDFGEFSDSCYEVSLGTKWRTRRGVVLEFVVTENLFAYRNSADIAAHMNLGWRF